MKIYTSYYAKMLKRHKREQDFYTQVSRNLGMQAFFKNVDGIPLKDLIDTNVGDYFGNFGDLDDYKNNLDDEAIEGFGRVLLGTIKDEAELLQKARDRGEDVDGVEFNEFLLCFENLDAKYTKKDKEKYPDDPHVVVGAHKLCHRTLLAEVLNERYNLGITEYKGD